MKMLSCAVLAVSTVLAACGGNMSQAQTARATARAAVDVAKDAWVAVANACVDVASVDPDAGPALEANCGVYLAPAHDLILSAGAAVDTDWSPKAACDLAQATALVAKAAQSVASLKGTAAVVAQDAATMAAAIAASAACSADAGAE